MRFFVFFTLSALAHWFLARWIVASWPGAGDRRGRRARTVYLVVGGIVVVFAGARFVAAFHEGPFLRGFIALALVELSIVVLGLVPLAIVMAVTRAGFSLASRFMTPPPEARGDDEDDDAPLVSRRTAFERIAGTFAFASSAVALGWGSVRGRHAFELEEVVVRVPDWPRALDGYTIAQISDIHVGMFVGERELDEGFELVGRIKPDLVVATGDLVDFEAERIGALARRLANVSARDGAAAIIGNHDHYAGAADVVAGLRAMKLRVLCNEGLLLREGDGGGFALLGVDDIQGRTRPQLGYRGPDLGKALAMVPQDRPRILLAHQPRFLAESAGRVALQLSGHTHGGQINPGFTPARAIMDYVKGRYALDGTTMWVNRGFGIAGPPARIGAPPEVTKIVIVAA